MPLARRHEHDHVTPQRVGGVDTVPACMNCHELKDRTPLKQWPIEALIRSSMALDGTALEPFIRTTATDTPVDLAPADALAALAALPPGPVRLLGAKVYAIGSDTRFMQKQATA
jgi:hypothetical protein